MIILPWTTETYWIGLVLMALPIPCFILILPGLVKNIKVRLLAILSSMLLMSDIFYLLFIVFGALVYNTSIKDPIN